MTTSYAVSPVVKASALLVAQPADSGLGVCTMTGSSLDWLLFFVGCALALVLCCLLALCIFHLTVMPFVRRRSASTVIVRPS